MTAPSLIDSIKNMEEALKCEVCQKLLDDPLLVAKCGHSICRQCFVGDFSMKCPICNIPVNTKDSLEDKLLNELLLQLKKLKNIVENDSKDMISVSKAGAAVEIIKESLAVDEKSISKEPFAEKLLDKTDVEIISPTAPNFSSSTPKIKRKKKMLPKGRALRQPTGENSIQDTSGNSDSNSSKRKLENSSKSEDSNKSKCDPSPNSSILSSSNLNKKNHKGETLLHRAVIKGDIAKVKDLIAAGASVNTQDNNGWTPLHEASNHGFVEIAKLLLDNGALVNVPSQKDNITPIHDALINDKMPIAILLASRGADMHAKTSLGLTALDLCKNEEDKSALIECCSPFISANIPLPNSKVDENSSKVVLLHTNLSEKQKEQLQKFTQMVKADIVDNFSQEVTHVITSCDNNGNSTRTMKVLLGILSGKWIMNFQWIEVCLEYKQKVDEEVFEVQGTKNHPNSQGPKKSRKNLEQKFPPLFDGFYFYLHGQFHKPTPEREDILNLIHLGGGKILSREPREETVDSENFMLPYHAAGTPVEGVNHIILYQERPPRDNYICKGHIRTTQVMWLIECISEFELKKCIRDT